MKFYLSFLALVILAVLMNGVADAKKYGKGRRDRPIIRPAVCSEPPKVVGHCKGALPRYSFIKATEKCELFSYGGCGGNNNNFLTKDECNCKCKAKKDKKQKNKKIVD